MGQYRVNDQPYHAPQFIKYLECSRLQRRQTLVRAAADLEPVQSIKANQLNDKRFKVKYSDHTLSNRIQILDC